MCMSSLNVQIIFGSDMEIFYIVIGCPMLTINKRIFKNSARHITFEVGYWIVIIIMEIHKNNIFVRL